jgi:hypothetical protein
MWQITVVCPEQEIPMTLITAPTGGKYRQIIRLADVERVKSLRAVRFAERSVHFDTMIGRPRMLFAMKGAA